MDIRLNGKTLLGIVMISSSIVLADFVSIVDTKSTGGINVTGGVTESQLSEAIQTAVDEVKADYGAQIAALETAMNEDSPIGSIAMWNSTTPPTGWVEMRGQSTSSYPELAAVIGGTIPDMRGVFARGWNNDASVDTGRTLGSSQDDAIRNITGDFGNVIYQNNVPGGTANGAITAKTGIHGATFIIGSAYDENYSIGNDGFSFDASNVVPTAEDNRPKNIALMYIIKAE